MRLLLLLLTATAAFAGEFALMANGSRLHVDRHEINGDRVKLYTDSGSIEMSASSITGFLAEEAPLPAVVTLPGVSSGTDANWVLVPPPPPPVVIAPPKTPLELADAAADKYHLPRALVRSVMATESGNQQKMVSKKGAIGLMQLMPETAKLLGADPYDPVQNVDAGVRYLRDMLERYDGWLWHALAAYNAGPGAVDKYHAVPPYAETINYVNRIANEYTARQAAEAKKKD